MGNKLIINPIGIAPTWMILPERNKQLANAISRYSDFENSFDKDILELVKSWALEIVGNCDTGIKMNANK